MVRIIGHRLTTPHGVFFATFNRKVVDEEVVGSVATFMVLFVATVVIIALGLAATGLDLVTSISGAATAVANVGPGLGSIIGPAGNFAPLPEAAKWLLSLGMILGRLEIVTIAILAMPHFWRS
jgi:trk system potassium uptake protein TrkH